jgi:hypothetical protein
MVTLKRRWGIIVKQISMEQVRGSLGQSSVTGFCVNSVETVGSNARNSSISLEQKFIVQYPEILITNGENTGLV